MYVTFCTFSAYKGVASALSASSSFRYLIVRVTSLTKSLRVNPAGYLPRFSSPSFTGVSAVFGDTGAVVLGFVGSVVTVGSTVIKSNT